ncbi:ran-binding protein M homolog [Physcomitrium patens]|uniref:B30.2/SPRY domain-containing protein n=1 Tax=Physcomitrium patens TaxID=3218 RepID=A0A2K1J9V5_PHYPA|nr:ran-binding protein M homolog [Physcomitrium patens]PNR38297.1 hypothetical protein PHYPA_021408 [Physcomitrium patens]|eukprot:XP_024398742.1 ran-binding protein M homolog [Physcomitrella patens]
MAERFCPFVRSEKSSSVMFRAKLDDDGEEEVEEEPTHLNTSTCSLYLVVSTDKLTAKYTGDGRHGNDVGAIQANRPAPCRRWLYYFEMTVRDRGQKGCTVIGFTDEHFKNSRQPGWEANSYGYHGDDGKLYRGPGLAETYAPGFTVGDTVGAGINYASQEIFFTKNGKVLSGVYKEVKTPLYPTIGLHSPNEKVEVNFGQRKFMFDVESMILDERGRRQRAVESLPLPPTASHSIVRAFLIHYGYHDTLIAFDAACGAASGDGSVGSIASVEFLLHQDTNGTADDGMYALDKRKLLRRLIREGNVDSVITNLQEWYPQVKEEHYSTILFLLRCQKFIELIRIGQVSDAVNLARSQLASFFGKCQDQDLLLHDCLALLAYERPQDSPMAYLLQFAQREMVADAVNAFILDTNPSMEIADKSGKPPQSALEKLLRQLTACHVEKRFLNGCQGEVFRLHRILQGGKDGGW